MKYGDLVGGHKIIMIGFKPKVGVLMATYNGAKFILEQLVTIDAQVGVDVTIFVSDDCSTDDTTSIVKEFAHNAKCNIVAVNSSIRYGSATSNFLNTFMNVAHDNFDYICFSDQDDVWLPLKLSKAISYMNKHSLVGYSSNVISWYPANGRTNLVKKDDAQTSFDFMFQGCGPGCTMVMKSDVCQKLALFLKNMEAHELESIWFHDWFVYAFFRANNYAWGIDNYSGMLYRQHDNNVIGANDGFLSIFRRLYLLKRWRKETLSMAQILGYENDLPVFRSKFANLYFLTKPFKTRRNFRESLMLFVLSILFLL